MIITAKGIAKMTQEILDQDHTKDAKTDTRHIDFRTSMSDWYQAFNRTIVDHPNPHAKECDNSQLNKK